jgi:hypothetical protein
LRTPWLAATLAAITVKLIFATLQRVQTDSKYACGPGAMYQNLQKVYSLLLNGVVLRQFHKQLQKVRKNNRTQNTGSGTNRFHSLLFWLQATRTSSQESPAYAATYNRDHAT